MTDRILQVNGAGRVLSLLGRAGRVGRVFGPSVDLFLAEGAGALRDQRRSGAEAASWTPRVRRAVYRSIWEDAASHHGATCEPLDGDFLRISRGGASTIVWYHTVMLDFGVSLLLALDKVAVHNLLGGAGLPMAPSLGFDASEPAPALDFLESSPGSCVVKPAADTSGGEGVTCGVGTREEFERAKAWGRRWDDRLLIEGQAVGEEYRLLFLDGELLDIVRRRPPLVSGDGVATVGRLIDEENGRRRTSGGWAGTSHLSIDLDCLLTLRRQGLSLSSVPERGRPVQVKTAANQNGPAQNETVAIEEFSPELVADAAAAAAALDLRFAGVEVITPDTTQGLRRGGGVIVEVNGTPGLQYHYLVADPGRRVPVARRVLEVLLDPARTRQFRAEDGWAARASRAAGRTAR